MLLHHRRVVHFTGRRSGGAVVTPRSAVSRCRSKTHRSNISSTPLLNFKLLHNRGFSITLLGHSSRKWHLKTSRGPKRARARGGQPCDAAHANAKLHYREFC